MRVTLKDIAVRLGVTKTTVSIALRDGPRVSLELREKVRLVAAEMGYTPDPFLKRLATYRHARESKRLEGTIGWLNHWKSPERLRHYREFEEYWRGAKRAAARMGYRLEECVWPGDCAATEMQQQLLAREVLGLLIPPHPPETDWGNFDWSRFSLMRFGLSVRQVDSNLVTADHHRSMMMAIQKIHSYGYRRIGLAYNQEHDRAMGGNQYGGFFWAHKFLGIETSIPPFDSETKTPKLAARTRRNLNAWMRKFQPEAILTATPEVPVILRGLGYRIPKDVAVASTSPYDIPVDAGIDQCPRSIGEIAAQMLIKQISLNERGEPDAPCRILMESRWKDGRSLPNKTRAARSSK
jgi:DNA-binding LacI/PurR family transcriptional regulator